MSTRGGRGSSRTDSSYDGRYGGGGMGNDFDDGARSVWQERHDEKKRTREVPTLAERLQGEAIYGLNPVREAMRMGRRTVFQMWVRQPVVLFHSPRIANNKCLSRPFKSHMLSTRQLSADTPLDGVYHTRYQMPPSFDLHLTPLTTAQHRSPALTSAYQRLPTLILRDLMYRCRRGRTPARTPPC